MESVTSEQIHAQIREIQHMIHQLQLQCNDTVLLDRLAPVSIALQSALETDNSDQMYAVLAQALDVLENQGGTITVDPSTRSSTDRATPF